MKERKERKGEERRGGERRGGEHTRQSHRLLDAQLVAFVIRAFAMRRATTSRAHPAPRVIRSTNMCDTSTKCPVPPPRASLEVSAILTGWISRTHTALTGQAAKRARTAAGCSAEHV